MESHIVSHWTKEPTLEQSKYSSGYTSTGSSAPIAYCTSHTLLDPADLWKAYWGISLEMTLVKYNLLPRSGTKGQKWEWPHYDHSQWPTWESCVFHLHNSRLISSTGPGQQSGSNSFWPGVYWGVSQYFPTQFLRLNIAVTDRKGHRKQGFRPLRDENLGCLIQ